MKHIIGISFLLALIIFQARGQTASWSSPGRCDNYQVRGNEVIFTCENNTKVMLKLCSQKMVKVWYAPTGEFDRALKSYAVIKETLEDIGQVRVNASPQAYEIFTSELRIRVNRNPFQLQIFDKYQKLLFGDYEDKGLLHQNAGKAAYKILRDDEHFYGLGEKSGPLDRRGKVYTMWNSDKPCYSPTEDPLYKSIPFFISNYNYGIFFDNTYKTTFDFGSESDKFYTFSALGGEMVYYFIFGKDYPAIIDSYTQLTGKPIMPPKWAFGFSQSRGMLTNEKLTREIAQGYRERNIPCDIIYQDIGWVDGLQSFNWRKDRYTDPKKMLSDLRSNGFKVIVSQDPVISQATTAQWKEADSLGFFTTDVRTGKSYDMPWPWGGNCGVVDFTDPAVADWWGKHQQKPLADGVSGFWTDMGEPAWSNVDQTDRLFMEHYAGMHEEIHNVYGLSWDRVVTEQFEKHNPNQRVFQMTRAGYAGMQRYTFGWSGDAGNGYNVTDGWKQLTNQIPMGLSAGMGLIPFWSCDISGYCGEIEDYDAFSELYVRWLQFGVFNPISRIHHEGNNAVEPWLFGREAEKIAKEAIELKYQLFPYIYTYARKAYDTGMPIMRALFLEYPNDQDAYKAEGQFLFGEELLVAPVVEEGATTKKVYFPEGEWIDFRNSAEVYKGSQWHNYPVTLDDIPVFVKKGSIVPTMPVMQYIHERVDYPVILKMYPAEDNRKITFQLYEDDGVTNDYKKDIYSTTGFSLVKTEKGYKIEISDRVENGYKPAQRKLLIEIRLKEKPKAVSVDARKIKKLNPLTLKESTNRDRESAWAWDKNTATCYIKIADSSDGKLIQLSMR
ncbi:MAG: TIM-barrel domain-containing protein [Fulvivirga sp.]